MTKKLKFFAGKWLYSSLIILGLSTITTFSLTWNEVGKMHQHFTNSIIRQQAEATSGPTVDYISWDDDTPRRIIDLFPSSRLANRVLIALRATNTNGQDPYSLGVNSNFTKEAIKQVKLLNLNGLNLTEIDAILNPALSWDNLWSIDLSNNHFGNYEIKFNKTKMPKLYKILATGSHLEKMIDVSSYVEDPFDKTTADQTDARAKAQAQYDNPIRTNVPRYFDVASNNIREIPKYFLKINLAYLNISNNKLGAGSTTDPMGVYATPWYSLKTTKNTAGLLSIQDPSIRGPYGIDIYNSGAKQADNPSEYKYTDEQVARWRQSPWPIRGLTFGNYNDQPAADGSLDSGVTTGTGTTKDSGQKLPFFSFSNNNLVAPMVFRNGNVDFDPTSAVSPQQKSVNVYAGLNDYQKSSYKTAQDTIIAEAKTRNDANNPNANAELLVPQPDSIFPFMTLNTWSRAFDRGGYLYSRSLLGVYAFRSFNGYGLFEQTQDSRPNNQEGNDWDNTAENNTNPEQEYAGTTALTGGTGIQWKVPKASDFGKTDASGAWTNLFGSATTSFKDFLDGTNNGKKTGFWGTKQVNTAAATKMSFTDPNDQTYFGRYKPFRTFLVTAKSFAKSARDSALSGNIYDSNLFYDAQNYENYNAQISLTPSGNNRSALAANYSELYVPFTTTNTSATVKHFADYFGNRALQVTGLAPETWLSNIDRSSSFGIPTTAALPYNSSLVLNNGLYTYASNFNVVDSVQTAFSDTNNFATSTSATTGLDLSEYQNKFPQNVEVSDILNGNAKFWKSNNQFDQVYMLRLNPQDVVLSYDPEAGSLTYQFRIYSPGYSRQGRLLQANDANATPEKNATPTIDIQVNQTVTGFAQAEIQKENNAGNFETFSSSAITDPTNTLEYQVPKSIADRVTNIENYSLIDATSIAKTFKTNYLGNKAKPNVTKAEIENNQSSLVEVDPQWISEITKNQVDGTIQFKMAIPDYTFENGINFAYPEKLKTTVYKWTGLPKTNTTVIGKNIADPNGVQTFVADSFTTADKRNLFNQIIRKPPSQITAAEIFQLGAVETDVATWNVVNATNAANYFELFPNNANGSLLWQVKIPGDPTNGIPEQRISVLWEHLFDQSTTITWKPQAVLQNFFLGKTPEEIKIEFKTDPERFITVVNKPTTAKITANDLVFASDQSQNFVINVNNGQIRFANLQLKNYYLNGNKYINGLIENHSNSTPTYLTIPVSPNYQGQRPVATVTWKPDAQILQAIKDYLKTNNLVQVDPNHPDLTTVDQVLDAMNVYDYKQALVNHNINLIDLDLFTLAHISKSDYQQTGNLNQNIDVDNRTGNLTFKNLRFINWQNDNSFTTTEHTLAPKVVQANPVVNSFVWANNVSPGLINKTVLEVATILQSPTQAPAYIDALNVGVKTFDANNIMQNGYRVDPTKIEIDIQKGTVRFNSGAVTVTNFITAAGQTGSDHVVTEAKTYSLPNKLSTSYLVNNNISSPNGFKDDYANFYYGFRYNAAPTTTEHKALIDQEVAALNAPNLVNQTAEAGANILRRWLIDNNTARISPVDLAHINSLKNQATDATVRAAVFNNFFYVPNFLGFVNSPVASGVNRTYLIAERIENSSLDSAILIIRNPFIVNYLNNGITSIHPISNLIFSGFLRNGTTIRFHKYQNQTVPEQLSSGEFSANFLPNLWANADAAAVKADLDFFTANRNNPTVKTTDRWRDIQAAWISTFTPTNVPYGGAYDTSVVYPLDITISNGERTLKVNKLLFPLFASTLDRTNPVLSDYETPASEIWYLNAGANTQLVVNPVATYEELLNQSPLVLLQQLGLVPGVQTDSAKAFQQFLALKVYSLLNGAHSVLTNNVNGTNLLGPVGHIGKIEITKSDLVLREIQISTPWIAGQIGATLTFDDIHLSFRTYSTELYPNNTVTIVQWLAKTFGGQKSVAELLFEFSQAIADGRFDEVAFNQMLQQGDGFFFIHSIFNDPLTQARLNPAVKLKDAVQIDVINGIVSFKDLQILNGYLDNLPQKDQIINVPPIQLTVSSNFNTEFRFDVEQLRSDPDLIQLKPSEIQTWLLAHPERLQALVHFPEASQQLEQPDISVQANDILGRVYIELSFQNFYENGQNLGHKNFTYTLDSLKNELGLVLGPVLGGSGAVGLAGLAYYFWRRKHLGGKKFYMAQTIVNEKK
ncbi:hypothetical protein J2Z62_000002 [Mycoplasmoides fastidiosum]|uniref:Uncharacterized protein n=1 Tax=Mycoplasmoides fastidiosum TaxID=92758 RepID=A0ABU0LXY8_9BACT|nr:hypothetical protein [Mycoplasmoides fastidiosum]MDQ0513564.1 hypothetical protein [Mycoplasmoides fastidiosum]UUD38013.1 hypothetical protein NPA10_01300 [Mycoplasmoides fastidiosum]